MTERVEPTVPVLSVVVPVYNSSRELEKCLDGLKSSRFDGFETWVVDDGSSESIEPLVRAHGFNYLRLEGPGGPARARNRGVWVLLHGLSGDVRGLAHRPPLTDSPEA